MVEHERPAHANVLTGLGLLKTNTFPTGHIVINCQMVGAGEPMTSALGRVVIIDHSGQVLYDVICRPDGEIKDYKTEFSHIRAIDMENGLSFDRVQSDVKRLIESRVLIGHAIDNYLNALKLAHPPELIRDTSRCPLLLKMVNRSDSGPVALAYLAQKLLGRNIKKGELDAVELARTALDLYRLVERDWEAQPREAPVIKEPAFNSRPVETEFKGGWFNKCCLLF